LIESSRPRADVPEAQDLLSNSIKIYRTMKKAFISIGLSVVLMETAGAQTDQAAPSAAVTTNLPPGVLVTKPGTVYDQFRIIKKDPAGLIIRYVPEGGGIGMEKVPFEFLPKDWQQRYNYDPQIAAKFELEQKQATAHWREKMIADEQASREKWARLEAEEEAARQAKRDAEAAKRAADAAAALGTNAPAILATNVPAIPDTNAPAILATNVPAIQSIDAPAITNTNQPPPRPSRPSRPPTTL
jgi:hypothetical protein